MYLLFALELVLLLEKFTDKLEFIANFPDQRASKWKLTTSNSW